MLGNISGNTCFCLCIVDVCHSAYCCCWECLEDRTQRNPPIFFLFWVENSYFLATVIPIFLFSKCHLSLDTL